MYTWSIQQLFQGIENKLYIFFLLKGDLPSFHPSMVDQYYNLQGEGKCLKQILCVVSQSGMSPLWQGLSGLRDGCYTNVTMKQFKIQVYLVICPSSVLMSNAMPNIGYCFLTVQNPSLLCIGYRRLFMFCLVGSYNSAAQSKRIVNKLCFAKWST